MTSSLQSTEIERVAGWLREAERIVILTGAGISTESGIPDFRGPQGLWTKNPAAEKAATLQNWVASPEVRSERWLSRANGADIMTAGAEPNAGHIALAELADRASVSLLVTQNVDGLHHAAGMDPARIIEIHGNVREFMCLTCDARGPIEDVLERVRDGEADPPCELCGGILKTATISFGQNLVERDLRRAQMESSMADIFLAVGTSLTVYPVAELPAIAMQNGARLVILNGEPTPYDDYASAVLRGQLGEVLPAIVEHI